jgi:hypothetical protein
MSAVLADHLGHLIAYTKDVQPAAFLLPINMREDLTKSGADRLSDKLRVCDHVLQHEL